MRSSSLESKTIRPGLTAYSFYRSDRHPAPRPVSKQAPAHPGLKAKIITLVLILVLAGGLFSMLRNDGPSPVAVKAPAAVAGKKPAAAAAAVSNDCAGNSLDKLVLVSVSQRKLTACEYAKTVYVSPVITGIEKHASTETPVGTYHVYAKQTDTVLTGADETGDWRDPVSYWMPFLTNQYGAYGFHDATWRPAEAFGKIDPATSDNASHGCVELPLGTAGWLYSWAPVGTTVTIKA